MLTVVVLQTVAGYSQTVNKQVILNNVVNRYWSATGDENGQGFVYIRVPDPKSILVSNRSGFILKTNGTFEEIGYQKCAQSRENYKGSWSISEDTIKIITDQNKVIPMKVLFANGESLRIK